MLLTDMLLHPHAYMFGTYDIQHTSPREIASLHSNDGPLGGRGGSL